MMKLDRLFVECELSAAREEAVVNNAIQSTKEDIAYRLKHYVTAYNYWKNNKDAVPDPVGQLGGILNNMLTTLSQMGVPIEL